jgi:hypothetical protein
MSSLRTQGTKFGKDGRSKMKEENNRVAEENNKRTCPAFNLNKDPIDLLTKLSTASIYPYNLQNAHYVQIILSHDTV